MSGSRRRAARRRGRSRSGTRRARRGLVVGGLLLVVLIVAAGLVAVGVVGASTYFDSLNRKLTGLQPRPVNENSVIFDRDGHVLNTVASDENRRVVPLAAISPWLPIATVAIEDRRFYEHNGVDWKSVARAAAADIKAGKIEQGGSTLTQQLMRGMYLTNDVSFDRKIKEAYMAVQYEKTHSKDQILELYLNTVPYGHKAYGAEAAALTYYSIHAKDLSLVQAALLAGLPQAPSRYDPFLDPKAARARRDEVLLALLDQGKIGQADYAKAIRTPLRLKRGRTFTRSSTEPYFTQYVRSVLENDPEFGAAAVRGGGLQVQTTIDKRLQDAAYQAMHAIMKKAVCPGAPRPDCDPAAALVAIDPRTGEIRAMASTSSFGRGGGRTMFNYALGNRQPGSTFKPFTLAAALEGGMDPSQTVYLSMPEFSITRNDEWGRVWGEWKVHKAENGGDGPKTVEGATLSSDNTVYAQLALDVGPDEVRAMAARLGIAKSELPRVVSLTLGAASVTPLEMTGAYAAFASMGVYHKPHAIREIGFSGSSNKVRFGARGKRVLADGVAAEVTRILGENITSGTGTRARTTDGRPQAGKTGTTEKEHDAWFCGYTPDLATCVWIGYPVSESFSLQNVEGVGTVFGGTLPAMIWHDFMDTALADVPPNDWPEPRNPVDFKPWLTQFTLRAQAAAADTTTGKTGKGGNSGKGTKGDATTTPAGAAPPPPPDPAATTGPR
jgi:penicillin-binding protein 1A